MTRFPHWTRTFQADGAFYSECHCGSTSGPYGSHRKATYFSYRHREETEHENPAKQESTHAMPLDELNRHTDPLCEQMAAIRAVYPLAVFAPASQDAMGAAHDALMRAAIGFQDIYFAEHGSDVVW